MLFWTVLVSLGVLVRGYGYGEAPQTGQEPVEDAFFHEKIKHGQEPVEDEFYRHHTWQTGQEPEDDAFFHEKIKHTGQEPAEDAFFHEKTRHTGQEPVEDAFSHEKVRHTGQEPVEDAFFHEKTRHTGQEPVEDAFFHEKTRHTGQEPVEDAFFHEKVKHTGQEPVEDAFFHEKTMQTGQEPVEDAFFHEKTRHTGQEPVEDAFFHEKVKHTGQEPVEDAFFHEKTKQTGHERVEDAFFHEKTRHTGQEPVEDAFFHEKTSHSGQEPVEDAFFHKTKHEETLEENGELQADSSYRKTGYSYGGYGGYGSKTYGSESYGKYSYGSHKYGGYGQTKGCNSKLMAPMNSQLVCTGPSDCISTCMPGYTFPSGVSELSIICSEGNWKVKEYTNFSIPSCSPTCFPGCLNEGKCIGPNHCQCFAHFYGPYCQYERKPCLDKPPLPNNSKMTCMNNQECSVTCMSGFQFHDGSTQTEIRCKEGEWEPVRKDWSYVADCDPICVPPCENGGVCLSYNKCQCPQEFRGQQCQYSTSACDVRVLGFNGNYKCSGDHESLKCNLTCPDGMSFQSPPSPVYTCKYENGKFQPPVVPRCIFDTNKDDLLLNYVFPEINETEYHVDEYKHKEHITIIHKKETSTWSCYTWLGNHYKTFSGNVKSFKNDCSKKLIDGDLGFQVLKIDTPTHGICSNCFNLLVQIDQHHFNFSIDDKKLTIRDGNVTIHAPKKLDRLKIELGSNSVIVKTENKLSIKWNLEDFVEIQIEKSSLNLANGICGVVNEESGTKLLKNDEGICESKNEPICVDSKTEEKAEDFCRKIVDDPIFEDCRHVVNVNEFYSACKWDFCACEMVEKKRDCGCLSISMFVKECRAQGVDIKSWRESDFCPMSCSGGKVYHECGKDRVCGGAEIDENCEEGCFCPEGTYSNNGTCIHKKNCPCKLRGRTFPPGKELPKDCNTCTCEDGSWVCTKLKCSARCEAVGDPHYLTFDKMNYEFMGKCSYIMLQTENYTIETENTPCDGAISQTMGYSTYFYKDEPSCTKSVTIKIKDTEIKLKQGKQVTVNSMDHMIPVTLSHAHIRRASSIFIQVVLFDGVEVMWDGKTRVYIQAPPSLKEKTKGLCGTFNGQRSDDFLTPEGDVEQDAISFGNKWKTKESCPSMNTSVENPCSKADSKLQSLATKICSIFNEPIFKECELEDDEKDIYYKFCLYDVCSCNHRPSECYCPIISAYADRCSKGGHKIDWRPQVRECGLRCPRGQVYEVCGSSCTRSCLDISRETSCLSCLEGCYCPSGYTMDHKENCIPISECPCIKKGLDYPSGYKEIKPDPKGPQLCTCKNALWECEKATTEELVLYKNNTMENVVCSAAKNQVYTHCEPSVPVTCQNMHSFKRDQSEAVCYGGCVCKKGYVLDSITNECVKPDRCPCHHGGQSFQNGDVIHKKCNTCTCNSGKWTCTEHQCPGTCTTWGDSHFKTFDNHIYDFQGSCEYVLVKGAASSEPNDCFSIIVELVPCGSYGVSCSKSVTLNVGSGHLKESVIFSDRKSSSANLTRITQRETDLYLFAEIQDFGIVLQWDKGTIISVKVDPKWKGRTKGLCGNYNDIYSDDFVTPSGGEESSVEIFGDSWKIFDYCPNAEHIKDTCELHPQRKSWALEKCSILKSNIFKRCHSEVSVDAYFEKCVFDSCGCDQGGDCNCLCTAISAYAQECNVHGVPVKWRSQELCPIQCDETCSEYSPCISTCPEETCEGLLSFNVPKGLCKQDVCVEGCQLKKCPEGQIYKNLSHKECISKKECIPTCIIEGKTFYEGDIIESDDCHRCFCTKNKKTCLGEPCKPLKDEIMTCISGWSDWMNNHKHIRGSQENEIEPLPSPKDFKENSPRCEKSKMKDVRCRTYESHFNHKETGENVLCSLETDGLICEDDCHDYEIQVLCECEKPTTPILQRERGTTQTPNVFEENLHGCANNEIWDDCAFRCDQLCNYAEFVLLSDRCESGSNCLAGCRPLERCPKEKRWRDLKTCVDIDSCTCASSTNEMVKPGEVVIGNCTTCQCINNEYKCHETDCHSTTTPEPTTFTDILVIQSTSSPPPACDDNRLKPLLLEVPDSGFSSSSNYYDSKPSYARLNNAENSWEPEFEDVSQYIEIDLGKIEAVYALSLLGSPNKNAYVTTFFVLYSTDGSSYSYITHAGIPEVFKGPTSSLERTRRIFTVPVEARYIRINPTSWVNRPALRVEIYGCSTFSTEIPILTTEKPPICEDEMSRLMDDRQIKVSSSIQKVTALSLKENVWVPLTFDKNQWIEFDFIDERTLTGVIVAGGGAYSGVSWRHSWVTSFTVSFSHDGQTWNPIINKDGTLQIFKGNSDPVNSIRVLFWDPILAKSIRIHPYKWHKEIAMRVEILGCYKPYKILPPVKIEESLSVRDCNLCPGVTSLSETCPCLNSNEWWNGEECSVRSRCPCFVGFIAYTIGAVFENEKCDQCVCTLNGISECKPKKCPPCENGLRQSRNEECVCECKPCPADQRLCPTSNICLPISSWCDGIIECPDDELNCTMTTPQTEICPIVECPPGYKMEQKTVEEHWNPFGSKSKWSSYFKRTSYTGKTYKGFSKYKTVTYEVKQQQQQQQKTCPQYQCVPEEKRIYEVCLKPDCSANYDLQEIQNEHNKCPTYACVPRKIKIADGRCNVTGRTFMTFDGTEYKYDICDHTIARSVDSGWSIKKLKNCNGLQIPPCIEITQGKDKIMITKDFNTYYNGFVYNLQLLQKIGSQSSQFSIQKADKFLIFISIRDFSVIWDSQGNIKVTVPGEMRKKVDGLCGLFDGNMENDRSKPDGSMAKTSVEFGDSWGESMGCEVITCPLHIQKEAWEKCQVFKEEPLSICASVLNVDKLMSQCVESMCNCVQQGNNSESCRCLSILETLNECQSKLPGVDLSKWRMNYDCPVDCPPGLVYKECFNKICEPCCSELMVEDACPETEECFPGCYCPDGYVRNMDRCVKPSECRDCQCDGYGTSRFVTFDRIDFTLNGKCTHTLAQTVGLQGLQFKVLITHKPCEKQDLACLHMITVLYKNHVVQLINEARVTVKIDGENIINRPFNNSWISVVESVGKCVTISIDKLQLDLEFFNGGKGFNLRLPSHLYKGATEGLCGSCNLNGTDDFKMSDGSFTNDISKFGDSWLVKDLPEVIEKEDSCEAKEIKTCEPPKENDPCLKLTDEKLFGHCFAVVDPSIYVEQCHEDLCHNGNICSILESYARECQNEGVCFTWRTADMCPYECPSGLEYEPCGIGCTETCDNYQLYRTKPEACTSTKGDTCRCPKGTVLRNETCIEERLCSPCDSEGHFPGDKWQPDMCTECTCDKGSIQCQRIQCTGGTVCSRGFKSVLVKGTETQCCPQHICVPEPTAGPICPEPSQPQCGHGQVMKLATSSSGCQEFICECKPKEECEGTEEEMKKERMPGMVAAIDNSGCCPKVVTNCEPSTCPQPPTCPEHHIHQKKDTEQCCPDIKCILPEGKCLYEMSFITGQHGGGERERDEFEKYTVLKSFGETWNDGPCRLCECKEGSTKAVCTVTSCSPPPESDNYVLKEKFVNDKCCPIYERVACKMGSNIYQVGQIWPSPDRNPCMNMTCEIGKDGFVSKQEIIENCKRDCKDGWSYHEPLELSGQCCGECKPDGCLVRGRLHQKDSIWFSEDNCTAYQCIIDDNQVRITTSAEKCPNIDDCPEERIYQDICCKKCNETIPESYSSCVKEPISPNDTIGIIVFHDKIHGKCVNREQIKGFSECKGTCDSRSAFDTVALEYKSKCFCCQPSGVHTIDVPLSCEDHKTMTFHLKLPNYCKCIPCEDKDNFIFK